MHTRRLPLRAGFHNRLGTSPRPTYHPISTMLSFHHQEGQLLALSVDFGSQPLRPVPEDDLLSPRRRVGRPPRRFPAPNTPLRWHRTSCHGVTHDSCLGATTGHNAHGRLGSTLVTFAGGGKRCLPRNLS